MGRGIGEKGGGDFAPQGTPGSVWRHLWLIALGRSGGVGIKWAEGRDAAGYPTMLLDPRQTKNDLVPNISSADAERWVLQRISSEGCCQLTPYFVPIPNVMLKHS